MPHQYKYFFKGANCILVWLRVKDKQFIKKKYFFFVLRLSFEEDSFTGPYRKHSNNMGFFNHKLYNFYMSQSKCSPWFCGHSVVIILTLQFNFNTTPKPGPKRLCLFQISDGVSYLSWWFAIFMANKCFVSRNCEKKKIFLAAGKYHWPTSENHLYNN